MPQKLVVIVGPTATGKTRLGIELCREFGGEVINADSRYLYRGFTIGVAKPSLAERLDVTHHLIDILEPNEEMSLALFQQRAYEAIRSVLDADQLPVLVGGTPLYVNAVVQGWRIPAVPPNHEFRRAMDALLLEHGIDHLTARLQEFDPIAAHRSRGNARRVIRALEVYEATGLPMSQLEGKGPRPFGTLELGLTMRRNLLFAAIDRRVDDQIAAGLVVEVESLLQQGVDPESPAFSSLGYRQLLPCLQGEISLEAAIARIKFDTHRYVRHQETWLKKNERLIRVDVTDPSWIDRCKKLVENFITPNAM